MLLGRPFRTFFALLALAASVQGLCQQCEHILASYQRGVDGVKRSGARINSLLDNAVQLSQDKVKNEYREMLTSFWTTSQSDAEEAARRERVDVSECKKDKTIENLVNQVQSLALACVAQKVPGDAKRAQQGTQVLYDKCDQFMSDARAVAEHCDSMNEGFNKMMCISTRLGTMGGRLGMLGGQVGVLGGQAAVVIDGNARQCVAESAKPLDTKAKAASTKAASCMYAKMQA